MKEFETRVCTVAHNDGGLCEPRVICAPVIGGELTVLRTIALASVSLVLPLAVGVEHVHVVGAVAVTQVHVIGIRRSGKPVGSID